jgi:hypothetical protein
MSIGSLYLSIERLEQIDVVHVGLRYCYSNKLPVVKTSDLIHPVNKYLISVSGIKKSPLSRRLSYLMKLDSKNAVNRKNLAVLAEFSGAVTGTQILLN